MGILYRARESFTMATEDGPRRIQAGDLTEDAALVKGRENLFDPIAQAPKKTAKKNAPKV